MSQEESGDSMLRVVKVMESDNGRVRYLYYAEQDNRPGLVELDMSTGEVEVIEQTPYEQDGDYPYYTNKAKGLVHRMWRENNFEVEKSLVWG